MHFVCHIEAVLMHLLDALFSRRTTAVMPHASLEK